MYREHEYYLKRCIEVSKASREHGNTPFGAILVDEDGIILLEQENVEISTHKSTGHAETQLAEKASTMYSKDFLWKCTLYTTAEPCAMCAGCIYWSNIGRVVYAMTEKDLLSLTGSDEQNHKTTYVSVYGVEQARQVAQQLLEQAKCDLDSMKLEEQANFLYDLADYVLERRH